MMVVIFVFSSQSFKMNLAGEIYKHSSRFPTEKEMKKRVFIDLSKKMKLLNLTMCRRCRINKKP